MEFLEGDALDVLPTIPDKSVHCCVTSPPYYGQRKYGGGAAEVGMEGSADDYIRSLRDIFRGVRRVLRDDGTLWLNLGDKYAKTGQLQGLPWRVALALQADGWLLRQDIVFAKPCPMPESVSDRCTVAHEYVFLFSKQRDYYYDAVAIAEPSDAGATKNRRSVWRIPPSPYAGAHFATMPMGLAELCIAAGTSDSGCCRHCGSPWERVVEREKLYRPRPNEYVKRDGAEGTGNSCANTVAGVATKTLWWRPTCTCADAMPVSCTVLDPFLGSGTTLAAAARLGRTGIGIDLKADYIVMARERVAKAVPA